MLDRGPPITGKYLCCPNEFSLPLTCSPTQLKPKTGSKWVVVAALIGNGLIAITKMIASAITGSSAMLSEAVHSIVDTSNQGLLLWGMKKSSKPADEQHPFGYGMELYFWTFVVAILIFAIGAGVSFYEGVTKLNNPHFADKAPEAVVNKERERVEEMQKSLAQLQEQLEKIKTMQYLEAKGNK